MTKVPATNAPARLAVDRLGRRLMVLLLLLSLALVYSKDLNRRLHRDQQRFAARLLQAQTQWEQLLLEQAVWTAPGRLQRLAAQHGLRSPKLKEQYDLARGG